MDNSFAPRPGQESHTSDGACCLCSDIPLHRPLPSAGIATSTSPSTRRRLCLQPLALGRPLRQGAEEATSLDLVDVCAVFRRRALFWTTFVGATSSAVRLVAAGHGHPVTDLERTWPEIRKGVLAGTGKFDDIAKAAPEGRPARADGVHP